MYMCIVNNLICKIRLVNKLIKKYNSLLDQILYFKYSFTNVLQVKKYILVNIIIIAIRTDV